MAKLEDIEIHTGKADFAYKPIRRLEVKCEASNALMPAPTVDEANGRLRAMAAKLGANAVIEAEYNSGISFTSWKSLKATGIAVVKESDEITCPDCAETIKRAAKKCRFCGSEITSADADPVDASTSAAPVPSAASALAQEPLKENNNPALIIGLVIIALFIFMLIAGSA